MMMRVRKFFLLYMVMAALAGQAFVPWAQASFNRAVEQDAGLFSSIYGGSVVICTPMGMKKISWDENGNPQEKPDAGDQHCPFYLSSFGKAVLSGDVTHGFDADHLVVLPGLVEVSLFSFDVAPPVRGPPFLFVFKI